MKKYIYFIHAIALCFVFSGLMGQEKETINVPLTHPGQTGTLKIGLINGSISVVGYAGTEVIFDAQSSDVNKKINKTESKKGMKRISGNGGFGLNIEEKNNIIEASSDNPNSDINVMVRVPKNFSLELSCINGGDITVDGVNGSHEFSNVNGGIDLKNISGSVVANTLNEDLNVSFTTVTPGTPMAFTSLNGDVNLTLPSTVKINIDAKTDNGDLYSDFDVKIIEKNAGAKSEKKNGFYKISKDQSILGAINGGGAEVLLKTLNGDIFIKKGN